MKIENYTVSAEMIAYTIVTVSSVMEEEIMNTVIIPKGRFGLSFSVTPTDLPDTSGIFLTITGILLDGKPLKGFIKQTIDLSAYQAGDIKLIYKGAIDTGEYRSVSLLFDIWADDKGETPGCYLLNEKGRKIPFQIEAVEEGVHISKQFGIGEDKTTELVVDFDIRKMMDKVHNHNEWVRVVVKDDCGFIKGSVKKPVFLPGDMYVLAYKNGELGRPRKENTKMEHQSIFADALACTKVKPYGSYELALLEEGDYEICLASVDQISNKVYMFRGKINPTSNVAGVLLNNIPVSAQSCVQLNIDIMGVI